jgi:hypothetical protein
MFYIWFRLIDWCLSPTLAVLQLHRGMHFGLNESIR